MAVSWDFRRTLWYLLTGVGMRTRMDFAGVLCRVDCPICRQHDLWPGWHFGFNWRLFIIVMLLDGGAGRGIKESAETNNIMLLLKIVAILVFVGFRRVLSSRRTGTRNSPNGWPGILTGGSIVFFTYIGIDSWSDGGGGVQNRSGICRGNHFATLVVARRCIFAVVVVLTGLVPWQTADGRRGAGGEHAEEAAFLAVCGLGFFDGALMGMISSLLVFQLGQAGLWFAMSRERIAAEDFWAGASADFTRRIFDGGWRDCGGDSSGSAGQSERWRICRTSERLFAFLRWWGRRADLRYREPDRPRAIPLRRGTNCAGFF